MPQRKTTKQKSRKPATKASRKVKVILAGNSPLRHFKLVEHKHTGKLLHRTHTSHVGLFILLILVGIFLYISQSLAHADQLTSDQGVTVSAVVSGAPPVNGATITTPTDQSTTDAATTDVSGTCEEDTLVVIYDNGSSAGNATCSTQSVFTLTIQLVNGQNALQALNYDSLNQAGPTTPTVTITSNQTVITDTGNVTALSQPEIAAPASRSTLAASNPAIIPALNPDNATTTDSCDNYTGDTSATQGGPLSVRVVCFIRGIQTFQNYQLGLLIQGGTAPYAINVNWGAPSAPDTLVSVQSPGYRTVDFAYPVPGLFAVKINAKDNNQNPAFTQTVAEVSGITPANLINTIKNSVIGNIGNTTAWFESPVPLYAVAVVLLAGFWVGDLFDRRFGARALKKSSRRKTA
jgi:hypothetical protein